jgi:hypothetical protein
MLEQKVSPELLALFGQTVEEFCKANGISPLLYFRNEPGRQGLLRLELAKKSSTRKRERYQLALRYQPLTHQRQQSKGEFERTRWIGSPKTDAEAIALLRAAVSSLIPPIHYELGWFQSMLAMGFALDQPRPLWTYDVSPLVIEYVPDIAAHFGFDPEFAASTEDELGDFAIAIHQRLLAGRLELPFGTLIQNRLNNYLVTPHLRDSSVVGQKLGEALPVKGKMSSQMTILSVAKTASGYTRMRLSDSWVPAAAAPETALNWREPFSLPPSWGANL